MIISNYETETIQKAIVKLDDKDQRKAVKDRKASAIYSSVVETLKNFCSQNVEFAEAILQTDRTVGDCCEAIVKNVGNSISDIEVYRRAAEFYFPGSKVEFQMCLYMCEAEKNQPQPEQKSAVILNLFDML